MLHDLLLLAIAFLVVVCCWGLWAWFTDLAWITVKHPWIAFIAAPVFVISRDAVLTISAMPHVSLFAAGAITIVIVRPLLDLLAWVYDLTRIQRIQSWPFFELEPSTDYRDRMKTFPPVFEWNYLQIRTSTKQLIDFEDERNLAIDEDEVGYKTSI